ncbi:MAG: hypothetical protein COV74_03480 [Candidatus Omnitrophica bacterium CG11_big_fil_rev_8_21_14_0_20_45_26]|uniref:Uncharacterized protein n=1 Tax=Candidatus Abzuiibacterium crystallinum TaxID=1974748 RepID=A0A2H0LQR4_9BACT|nr:MAG: hypothetical protein COV74_03480 [Candidatus Omnitrophica bacterium CG11_big_fil_rev_8_21_14_0_20_45_26]PIW63326.1 MAG: hypothetical protein COW12_10820 [Candidatus Omnitrophica bacterium CG12_big_fil_rev_8_21_14_0_65_45_16]
MEQKQVDQKKIESLKRIQDALRYWTRKCKNNSNELAKHIAFLKAIDEALSTEARSALKEMEKNRESELELLRLEMKCLELDIRIEKGEEVVK